MKIMDIMEILRVFLNKSTLKMMANKKNNKMMSLMKITNLKLVKIIIIKVITYKQCINKANKINFKTRYSVQLLIKIKCN